MSRMFRTLFVLVCTSTCQVSLSEEPGSLSVQQIRQLTDEHADSALELYREFLRLPNDASYPDDILRMVDWMESAFADRGFEMQRIETPGSPLLLAERNVGAGRTVLVYLQSDGQPVDRSAWFQDDPYEPVLKHRLEDGVWEAIAWESLAAERDSNWRVFARSASDSKGPMTQFMIAMDAMSAAGVEPAFNLKVIIDTEEEQGSPNLPAAVEQNRALLAADMLLIFDGPPHASNEPTVKFGARGIVTVTLTAHGPRVAQHSGHYGNYIPNPALRLAQLLASMKSDDGTVSIDGFYDGVEISDELRARLARVPDDEPEILREIGVAEADKVAGSLQEALQYPSLNIRGLSSGWVGKEVRTIIPPTATAEIDIRLVRESDPERLVGLVRRHIEEQGYLVLDRAPTDAERRSHPRIVTFTSNFSYSAYRSDFDEAAGRLARAGLRHLYGEEPILIRTSGGSIPISPFVETLGVPAASVPTVNIDNNQHSPNENLKVGNFLEGIAMMLAVLSRYPD